MEYVLLLSVRYELSLYTGELINTWSDHKGNKRGSMSGTRAISTTSRRELSSSSLPPHPAARQGAKGISRHSDRNISLFPSWSGWGLISNPVYKVYKVKVLNLVWRSWIFWCAFWGCIQNVSAVKIFSYIGCFTTPRFLSFVVRGNICSANMQIATTVAFQ